MKIDCKPNKHEKQNAARTDLAQRTVLWKQTLPFNVNPRGVLIHRVRQGQSHEWDGEYSHDSAHYWCANQVSGDGVNLTDDPPKDKLLCVHCETNAVAHGEPSAEELTGRHVCIGEMKAHRLCCRNEKN